MKNLLSITVITLLILSPTSYGASTKNISSEFSADDFESIRLEVSVGELDIEVWDGDEIALDIELMAERSWWSLRRRNIDDVELEVREFGDELSLSIEEKNIGQSWVVKIPAKLAIEVEMGVGEIRINDLSNTLILELGVGEVKVNTADIDFGHITASVGVGDSSIRGFGSGRDNERSFVSAESYYEGEGEFDIEIELGVGDISIRK